MMDEELAAFLRRVKPFINRPFGYPNPVGGDREAKALRDQCDELVARFEAQQQPPLFAAGLERDEAHIRA